MAQQCRFGWRSQAAFLEALGARLVLRQNTNGTPFKTDQGNLILDCHFGPISQPAQLAARMSERAGIVEHGLFLGLATDVIVATSHQGIRHLKSDALGPGLSRACPEPCTATVVKVEGSKDCRLYRNSGEGRRTR